MNSAFALAVHAPLQTRVTPSLARLNLGWNSSRGIEERACSGFIVSSGELVTCEHCVSDEGDCAALVATFENGATARCHRLVRANATQDIAVVELEWQAANQPPRGLTLANHSLEAGSHVVVAGYPVSSGRKLTFTEGQVLQAWTPAAIDLYYDAPTAPGNSGSPVLDASSLEVTALHCGASTFGGQRRAYGPKVELIHEAKR